jgi:hypothetical protein
MLNTKDIGEEPEHGKTDMDRDPMNLLKNL